MSVTAPGGFTASGAAAGVKGDGALDLALVAAGDGRAVPAAAVFTANAMAAAPVVVSRGNLEASGGEAAAVILNSGNANAGTGQPGCEDAEGMCALTAAELGCDRHHVLVCSTGLIGNPLPMPAIESAIPGLVAARSADGGGDAAAAILTTDTVAKETLVEGPGFLVGGMAKGAAMLAPNMATMLAVLTTDAVADHATLLGALRRGVATSFNTLTVDGAQSTNDTVIVLADATGAAVDEDVLARAFTAACSDLAHQMARDAEGATRVVRISVRGASSDLAAATAARRVAESQLVKCSWYGADPYWGRIASELGAAGVPFDQRLVSISYGGVTVAARGVAVPHDEAAVAAHVAGTSVEIEADLGLGTGSASVLSTDLGPGYIDENAGTS